MGKQEPQASYTEYLTIKSKVIYLLFFLMELENGKVASFSPGQ